MRKEMKTRTEHGCPGIHSEVDGLGLKDRVSYIRDYEPKGGYPWRRNLML